MNRPARRRLAPACLILALVLGLSSLAAAGAKDLQKAAWLAVLGLAGRASRRAADRGRDAVHQATADRQWQSVTWTRDGFDSVSVYTSETGILRVRNGRITESVTAAGEPEP